MKSLIKVAILSSLTTAAVIYVLLAWKPLGDIQHSPIISWASYTPASQGTTPAPTSAKVPVSEDEQNNIEVYQKTSSGVVNITSKSIAYTFFNQAVPQSGTGSGVIIDYAGHIVTNHHVIEDANSLEVTLADKSVHNARVVGDDPNNDLAVIQIDVPKEKLSPIPFGSSKGLQVGQKVLAIGNPYRMDHTLTTGIISALGRSFETQNKRIVEGVIQTDAAINPGNSGGPLLNAAGQVIGINSQILSSGGGSVGIGFAIPVDTVYRITSDLIALGYVRRPYIGIGNVGSLEENPGFAALNQIEPKGLLVLEVIRGTPADTAGLVPAHRGIVRGYQTYVGGDIILAMDGVEINSVGELGAVIDRHKAGQSVKLTILRGGQKITVPVTLQEAPREIRFSRPHLVPARI